MNILVEKLELIEWITRLDDSTIIDKLKDLRNEFMSANDWWDDISENDKESIKRGLNDIREGRIHSHDSVKKVYEKYL